MKKITMSTKIVYFKLSIMWAILFSSLSYSSPAQIPKEYYDSIKGLKGQNLKVALHKIASKDHRKIPYRGKNLSAWDVLKESDRDSLNRDNVILFYTGRSVNAAQEYNGGLGWNKEHVWAKSHGNFKENSVPFNDLHNLKPTDSKENIKKGNKDFDCGGYENILNSDNTRTFFDKDSWEPHDFIKGDVARILFYMAVRYEGDDGNPNLELVDSVNSSKSTKEGKGFYGKQSTLLAWNKSDPVSNLERKRNEIIFKYQRNRNPFIDHPEFADLIWSVDHKEKNGNAALNNQTNKFNENIINDVPGNLKPFGKLISENGDIIKEFEFVRNSWKVKDLLLPGNYILKITVNNEEQIYRVIISK